MVVFILNVNTLFVTNDEEGQARPLGIIFKLF